MILQELDGIYWDVIVLAETKREAFDETFDVPSGHVFYGSGRYKGSRGVGLLVHERVAKHKLVAVSECMAILDLKCFVGEVWIFAVYMPDASYPDEEIDTVYELLRERFEEANRRRVGSC